MMDGSWILLLNIETVEEYVFLFIKLQKRNKRQSEVQTSDSDDYSVNVF